MSSGFVSGGTSDQPRERNELWHKAEQELEAARQRKLEQKNHDGKSLYEVLQENKAAKQEAFEEAAKLKHQFRSLDEDDVAFLNSVRDSETAKERAVQQETLDQLDMFRKLQQKAESAAANDDAAATVDADLKPEDEGTSWQVSGKKKKRDHTLPVKGFKGVKIAKTASKQSVAEGKTNRDSYQPGEEPPDKGQASPIPKEASAKPIAKPATSFLGLGGYSSEDD